MIISASWLSRTGDGDGTLNLRGISTLLALAAFLKRRCIYLHSLLLLRLIHRRLLTLGKGSSLRRQ
jgi:glycosylphosphatidylinositol transamidase